MKKIILLMIGLIFFTSHAYTNDHEQLINNIESCRKFLSHEGLNNLSDLWKEYVINKVYMNYPWSFDPYPAPKKTGSSITLFHSIQMKDEKRPNNYQHPTEVTNAIELYQQHIKGLFLSHLLVNITDEFYDDTAHLIADIIVMLDSGRLYTSIKKEFDQEVYNDYIKHFSDIINYLITPMLNLNKIKPINEQNKRILSDYIRLYAYITGVLYPRLLEWNTIAHCCDSFNILRDSSSLLIKNPQIRLNLAIKVITKGIKEWLQKNPVNNKKIQEILFKTEEKINKLCIDKKDQAEKNNASLSQITTRDIGIELKKEAQQIAQKGFNEILTLVI